MSPPRASLIISTWNGRHLLESCLPRAVRAVEQAGGDHEIIVVDDASRDDTVEYVRREFLQVRLLPLPRNLRFAGANNAAARIARGEVLVFLNNDMWVEPDFLPPLLRHFRDPEVFAVTAQIEMPPSRTAAGVVQETGLVRACFQDGFFVLRHERPASPDAVPVLYAGGGSSAWRRQRFWQLGGFDRLLRPFYFEDLDLSYRAQKAGWRVLFEPSSRVFHQHRQTNRPGNFPPGYVERMFGKNTLLFTWKVLTDPDLIGQHFRALWRRLMRPRDHPQLAACFLRAARQLPELLAARRRMRPLVTLSDQAALARASAPQDIEAAEAGDLPVGSAGTGKRILVIGSAPLPWEREARLDAACFRTWHIAQALLRDGHEVTMVAARIAGGYHEGRDRPPVLRFQGTHFTYYSASPEALATGQILARICEQSQPEAVVAISGCGGWLASRLPTEAPLWVDLLAPTLGAAPRGEGGLPEAAAEWEHERAALGRGDAFSVATERHRYVLLGQLVALGRLRTVSESEQRLHCLPHAAEEPPFRPRQRALRGRVVGGGDFVVLSIGRYDGDADTETLFEALLAAMREEPRVRFVSLGGALPGDETSAYHHFRRRAEASDFAGRFVFLGWVPNESLLDYYAESDVGVVADRAGEQALRAERYRVFDMLRAGLPVIASLGSETSRLIEQERLGLTFKPGDIQGLKEAILGFSRDEPRRRRCGARAREWLAEHRSPDHAMAPLRAWARSPVASEDRLAGRRVEPGAWQPSARLLRERLAAVLADVTAKAFVRRRGVAPWGLDPRNPAHDTLVIRAGSVALTREVVARTRRRFPAAAITVLAPAELEAETRAEVEADVVAAPGAGGASYRIGGAALRAARGKRYDTIVVAGEDNRRAERLARLAGRARRVEVREDGAAHVFGLAPHKPLLLLGQLVASIIEKLTLTAGVGLVWGAIAAEGGLWQVQRWFSRRV